MDEQKSNGISLEWILVAAIAIAIVIRLSYLGVREFWYDEVLSLLLSTGQKINYTAPPDVPVPLDDYAAFLQLPSLDHFTAYIRNIKPLLQGLAGGEPHPPLFFLAQYVWLFIAGTREAGLRSLNVLLSIVALVGAYGMGQTLLGRKGGLLMAALLGLNPCFWFHSLNLRMYCPTVTWVTLSGWAMLELCQRPKTLMRWLLWSLLLIGSVAAGLLTFYLFFYWVLTLVLFVLVRDRQRWWQHALRLGIGGIIPLPWYFWGLPQQLRNADFERFSGSGLFGVIGQHFQGFLEPLGNNLVIGDWATLLPLPIVLTVGLLTAIGLSLITWQLYHQDNFTGWSGLFVLAFMPFWLALGADILSGKSALSWGAGRSAIFILPGLLLLVSTWLIRSLKQWQKPAIISILMLYMLLSVGDMTLRQRQVLHQAAAGLKDTTTPTLVILNSKAWGHVLRIAYYLPKHNLDLLAVRPAELPEILEDFFSQQPQTYSQILWLEALNPLWNKPKTEAETLQIRQAVNSLLEQQYKAREQIELAGTMPLDQFVATYYSRS